MKIIRFDISYNDAKKTANCYSSLVNKKVNDLGDSCYEINIDGNNLFFCSKEMAGTPDKAIGVHQLHIQTSQSYDNLIKIADVNSLKHEMVQFGPCQTLCVWDIEQNPIIFSN